jgi:hypothetical protein
MKGGETMADETKAILEILRSIGVYDWVVSNVKDQAELIRMFKDDFQALVAMCQK